MHIVFTNNNMIVIKYILTVLGVACIAVLLLAIAGSIIDLKNHEPKAGARLIVFLLLLFLVAMKIALLW